MEIFIDDEAAYIAWVNSHPGGFLLNVPRQPGGGPLVLHRATCLHIAPATGLNYTGGAYYKIVAATPAKLQTWARTQKAHLITCKDCAPDAVLSGKS